MNIIRCMQKEDLEDLYDDSSLTFEGMILDEKEYNLLKTKFFEGNGTKLLTDNVYVVKGSLMNHVYNLTGHNAYQNDLSIICFKLAEMENPLGIAIPRFELGGRWFDDVVDNNVRREQEKAER